MLPHHQCTTVVQFSFQHHKYLQQTLFLPDAGNNQITGNSFSLTTVQNFTSIGSAVHQIQYQCNDAAEIIHLFWGHPQHVTNCVTNNRTASELNGDLLREKITKSFDDQHHLTRCRCYRITKIQTMLITANRVFIMFKDGRIFCLTLAATAQLTFTNIQTLQNYQRTSLSLWLLDLWLTFTNVIHQSLALTTWTVIKLKQLQQQ